jgi:hypothetical protein
MSEAVQAEGVVQRNDVEAWDYGSHLLMDDAGGDQYLLRSESEDLEGYVGERATVTGTLDPEYGPAAGRESPALLIVTDIERGSRSRRSL